jgi:hypothetical protein
MELVLFEAQELQRLGELHAQMQGRTLPKQRLQQTRQRRST